jgi:hypothetical protein
LRRLEKGVDFLDELVFCGGADDLVDNDAVVEKKESGDVANGEACGEGVIVIDVDFADDDLVVIKKSKLFDDRRNQSAGATPFGPEVEDKGFVLREERLKGGVGDVLKHDRKIFISSWSEGSIIR